MIDSLLSSPTTKMLEQTLSFTEQRHLVLLDDLANVSVPGFVQQDVSVAEFQKSLKKAVKEQRESFNARYAPESGETVEFDNDESDGGSGVLAKPVQMVNSVAFHDRGVRNMEYLMSSLADNAMAHNMTAQFLKFQNDQLGRAISMKV